MLGEMVLLGLIARNIYKRELPDLNSNKTCIVTTHVSTINTSMVNENNNNAYINDTHLQQQIKEESETINERF